MNGRNLKKTWITPLLSLRENKLNLLPQNIANMKTIKELNEKNMPIVRIDNSLEKYKNMPLFQDKVEKANEVLRTVGLPKLAAK